MDSTVPVERWTPPGTAGAAMPGDRFGPIWLTQAVCLGLFLLAGTDMTAVVLGEGSVLARGALAVSYPGILLLCLVYHRTAIGAAFMAPALLALVALACLSVLWSISPNDTAKRLLSFVSCTALGMLVGYALSLRGLVLFLGALAGLIGAVSLVAIGLFPAARGAPPWDDVWRGIFTHKNALGGACAIGLPFALYAAVVARGGGRWLFAIGAILLLFLLAVSQSRTSQIIGALAVMNLGLALLFRRRQMTWALITMAALVVTLAAVPLLLATGAFAGFFEAIGRQPTMSGRLPIWTLVWGWIEQRPLLGYGYAAFWDPESRRIFEIARNPTIQYVPFYSHNGMIETLLDVGAVGFALLLVVLAQALVAILRILAARPGTLDLAPMLVFLVSFCLANISEATALQRDNLVWIMFAAVIVRLMVLARAAAPSARSRPPPETISAPGDPCVRAMA